MPGQTEPECAKSQGRSLPSLTDGNEVVWSAPLPQLDTGWGEAFTLRGKGGENAGYALVDAGRLPLRQKAVFSLKGTRHPGVVLPDGFGVVKDMRDGKEKMVLALALPPPECLWPDMSSSRVPMEEGELVRQVLRPLSETLRFLHGHGIAHGGVRPSNMFLGASGLVLGECVSEPASWAQPDVFEPYERALAHAAGRGEGTIRDDMYSLGVSVLCLLAGHVPGNGGADAALLADRAEQGSLAFFLGGQRVPSSLQEPLRGMLNDDPAERWDVADLEAWLQGRRQPARTAAKGQAVSARPIMFGGREWHRARSLALALGQQPEEAVAFLKGGEVARWVRRSLTDSVMAERLESVVATHANSQDLLLSHALLVLDPPAPVFSQGVRALPGGIGTLMAALCLQEKDMAPVSGMLSRQLPSTWIRGMQGRMPDAEAAGTAFDQLAGFMRRAGHGAGVERCLYELLPSLPCCSPLLRGRIAFGPADAVAVLEEEPARLNADADARQWPMERHFVSFFAAHERDLPDGILGSAGGTGKVDRVLALARILALVQERHQMGGLPHLCGWIAGQAGEAVERFHSRMTRQAVTRDMGKAVAQGQLSSLVALLSGREALMQDGEAFAEARTQYRRLGAALALLRDDTVARRFAARQVGRRIAVIVSSILAGLVLVWMFVQGGLP